MLTVEGTYRDGAIELAEKPEGVKEARVLVTFLGAAEMDLRAHGISEAQAVELRSSFATFAEDWEKPEMNVYDDYDAAKAELDAKL